MIEERLTVEVHKKELRKLISELLTLKDKRNKIVHSLWLPDHLEGRTLKVGLPSATKKTAKGKLKVTRTPYTAEEILSTVDEITDLVRKFQETLKKI